MQGYKKIIAALLCSACCLAPRKAVAEPITISAVALACWIFGGSVVGTGLGLGGLFGFRHHFRSVDRELDERAFDETDSAIMLLDYASHVQAELSTSQMDCILDDLISKTRVIIATRNPDRTALNACLLWAILVAGNPRGALLLQEVITAGGDPNYVDIYGNSPLSLAIHFHIPEAVTILLETGANLKVIGSGQAPLSFARQRLAEAQRMMPSDFAIALRRTQHKILDTLNDHIEKYGHEARPDIVPIAPERRVSQ